MKIYDIVSDLSAEMGNQTNAIITGIVMKQNTISTYSTTTIVIYIIVSIYSPSSQVQICA